jgi:hypothetical protein
MQEIEQKEERNVKKLGEVCKQGNRQQTATVTENTK